MKPFAAIALLIGALLLPTTATAQESVAGGNAFAIDLYHHLSERDGNLFFSPYGLSTALEMVFAGARGQTASEMAKILHEPRPVAGGRQRPDLAGSGIQLHVANALWGQAGTPFKAHYLARIKTDFGGGLYSLNFGDEAAARQRINDWASKETEGKITKLIAPGALTPEARLVLTDAVYFKARWSKQFRPDDKEEWPFHITSRRVIQAKMMFLTDDLWLAKLDGFRLLDVPYLGGASMVILLPDRIDGLANVEAEVTARKLDNWIDGIKNTTPVQLGLPKFTNRSTFNMSSALRALGLRRAFDRHLADFTGIANVPGHRLYISKVVHQAYVAVDEGGTEAAAATATIMAPAGARCCSDGPVYVPFIADHPFLYLVRDDVTGDILFMGRMDDPTK